MGFTNFITEYIESVGLKFNNEEHFPRRFVWDMIMPIDNEIPK